MMETDLKIGFWTMNSVFHRKKNFFTDCCSDDAENVEILE